MQRMTEFVVKGHSPFPFDMLRYDSCWPRSERDAGVIETMTLGRRYSREPVEIGMKGLRMPTEARWESFGWRVVSTTKASSGRWAA